MRNVDIIIPVYNGLEDLKKCMKSIKKHTDLEKNRVIIVNDHSPDEHVYEYLVTQQDENIILIDSPVNEGFSASVNKGICYSDRDVILLNSDTIVTSGWVEKIVRCAYSDDAIGTVTPLSNSATLCSVPIICQDNDIPEGRTVDSYAEIIEKCSMKKYPEITVAVGFCMHIKREVIEQVGLFDGKTFERGYGEENDFCNRAGLLGYKHVLCDDTLIYHKGTVSFVNEDKKALIEKHTKILDDWYPYQMRKNHLYCMNNPDQYIRDNIEIWNGVLNGKTNILLMVQSDFREDASDHIGGTQFHVKDLVEDLKKKYNVFVAARDLEYLRLTMYDEEKMLSFKFHIGAADAYPQIHDMKVKKILRQIIEGFAISLIHVHHVYGLSFDIFEIAKELNVPYMMTVHDYYYICPVIKLNNCQGTICDTRREEALCAECLNKKRQIASHVNFIKKWRTVTAEALEGAEKVIFPSVEAKRIFGIYYPDNVQKYMVIEHGLDKTEFACTELPEDQLIPVSNIVSHFDQILDENFIIRGWAFLKDVDCKEVKTYLSIKDSQNQQVYVLCNQMERHDVADQFENQKYVKSGFEANVLGLNLAPGKLQIQMVMESEGKFYLDTNVTNGVSNKKQQEKAQWNVAFLGGLVPEKGSQLAYQLIQKVKSGVNWYIIGGMNDSDLEHLEQSNLTKLGAYDRKDTYRILSEYQIDILCILPTWPETFCYTLSEAWLAGIPAICTSIGALTERFQKHDGGWVIDLSDHVADDLETLVKQLCNHPELVEAKKAKVNQIHMKSVKEMCDEYQNLYVQVLRPDEIKVCKHKELFLEAFMLEKNRFYGDTGRAAEYMLNQKTAGISHHYEVQLARCQGQYQQLLNDYGSSMRRLDRIRKSIWYKLYVRLRG